MVPPAMLESTRDKVSAMEPLRKSQIEYTSDQRRSTRLTSYRNLGNISPKAGKNRVKEFKSLFYVFHAKIYVPIQRRGRKET